MKSVSLAMVLLLTMIADSAAHAGGCAADISAYRRAHGLSAVRADAALDRIAQRQATAMARAETVSHTVDGNFPSTAIFLSGSNQFTAGLQRKTLRLVF